MSPILTEASLNLGNLDDAEEPFALFGRWFEAARAREINDPEAMSLATVDPSGLPDVRMVLCKSFSAEGLIFYTNAKSAKGVQIEASPRAAALFHWKSIRRQARFRGSVRVLDASAADVYFHSRPRVSQVGAWASHQSRPLESRAVLEGRVAHYTEYFGEKEIQRPTYWRGFLIEAREVELWADGAFRLHDRVRFLRSSDGWSRQRLFP